jgi:hypothetical protein
VTQLIAGLAVLSLVAALLGIRRSWFRRSARRAPRPPFLLEITSEEISLRAGTELRGWLRWSDVEQIRAFKVDCYAYDLMCIAVESAAPGAGFVVDEEHPQFRELIGEMGARLSVDPNWFSKVALPAFARNETVLYRRGVQG